MIEAVRQKKVVKALGDNTTVNGITSLSEPPTYESIEEMVESHKLVNAEDATFNWIVNAKDKNNPDAEVALKAYENARQIFIDKGIQIPKNIGVSFGYHQRKGKATSVGATHSTLGNTDENFDRKRPVKINLNHRGAKGIFKVEKLSDLFDDEGNITSDYTGKNWNTVEKEINSPEDLIVSIIVHEMGHAIHNSNLMEHNLNIKDIDVKDAFKDLSNAEPEEILKHANKHKNFPMRIARTYKNKLTEDAKKFASLGDKEPNFKKLKPTIAKKVSRYASTEEAEFVAEMFTALTLDVITDNSIENDEELRELIKAYNAYGGASVPGKTDSKYLLED